ncbi:MAG: hypothetical protein RTU63_04745 [Candidatus Thorarchaeota archaeon]
MEKKWKIREERAEKGLILSMVLFLILTPLGLFLENDIIAIVGALMMLYLPGMLVTYTIWAIRDDLGKWKKKRRKAKRYSKIRSAELVVCKSCDIVYTKDELDLSPSADPRCPACGKLLKIKE